MTTTKATTTKTNVKPKPDQPATTKRAHKPAKASEPAEPKYTFTAEQIEALRDGAQNSWAKVADLLELGSPGAARRAYSVLVRPHKASVLTARTGSASGRQPVDFRDLDVKALAAHVDRVWLVQRAAGNVEEIPCAKVTGVKDGTISFSTPDGKRRSVKAETVVAVK